MTIEYTKNYHHLTRIATFCALLYCNSAFSAELVEYDHTFLMGQNASKEGANKQVISSQADSLIKISRIWADFFPANNRISLFRLFFPPFLALFPVFTEISPTDVSFGPPETGWPG